MRRRFSFVRLRPEYEILRKNLDRSSLPSHGLISVLRDVNSVIDDANFEIGISYFMKDLGDLREALPSIWTSEIEPYLEEFFYDQPGKVDQFRWGNLSKGKLADWIS
jgi:5-methylcytosine-specific restriction protein B